MALQSRFTLINLQDGSSPTIGNKSPISLCCVGGAVHMTTPTHSHLHPQNGKKAAHKRESFRTGQSLKTMAAHME